MTDKALGMLGLARRAGKLIYGSDTCALAVRSGKAQLIVVACDASDRTKKLMHNKCTSYDVPVFEYSDIEELGRRLGRSGISVVGVSDGNFAKAIKDIFNTI